MPELRGDKLPQLILASASPRRRELLLQLGITHWSIPSSIDETSRTDESPDSLVARLSAEKAAAISESQVHKYCADEAVDIPEHVLVLGADTVIDLDDRILGKPRDEEDAVRMLMSLSDKRHRVITGVTVRAMAGQSKTISVASDVRFAPVSEAAARAYWRTGEPQGKAGAYAIQGFGARFISHLSGSYSNVVGLPLFESSQLLGEYGLSAYV